MFYLQHMSKHQHAVVNRSKAVVSVAAVHTDRKDKYAVPVLRLAVDLLLSRGAYVSFSVKSRRIMPSHAKSASQVKSTLCEHLFKTAKL